MIKYKGAERNGDKFGALQCLHLCFIEEEQLKPAEEEVVVESSLPVSLKQFGEIQLELPIKEEDLPPKESHQVSEKEIPESKPTFDEVQVFTGITARERFTLALDRDH